jgi:hypothetical protein
MTCCCQPKETLQLSKGTPKGPPLTQMDNPAATQRHVVLASLILEFEQLFGFVPADEDEIEDSKHDSFSPWINSFPDTDPLSLIHIAGDENQQNKLRLLSNEFRDIFSHELPASPASIPPFENNVDDKLWKVSRNRAPPRPQSTANQADIVRQLAKLEEQGIIEKGYHQAPLTLAARVYTAFILFCGVYQFIRLPFGPKRAPSYFQQNMATVVLAGLIYVICEMYIDDCNVFGKDTDELVYRLRLIFERFRKHNLFVKQINVFLAMPKLITLAKSYLQMDLKRHRKKYDMS